MSPSKRHLDFPSLNPENSPEQSWSESEVEREFIEAIRQYQCASGRMFPTWSEVLDVIRSLGYEKTAAKGC